MDLTGEWRYSLDHQLLCRVIETQTLWGETTCRVWLPSGDSVVRIPASRLRPPVGTGGGSADEINYVAAAARVADALTQGVLLAPIESSVIPLPHQIHALSRAMAGDRVRFLLADEVGLGKTIEAGLIMRELKLRGLVKRTLVIAPKGLVTQWVSEMRFHFGETFQFVLAEDMKTLKRFAPVLVTTDENTGRRGQDSQIASAWLMFSQVVVPMDSVKPLDKRRGWTATQLRDYNQERFEDLISAGWDLVIVDEAHRLAGSTDEVARFKLGLGLSEAAPYLLLLSATPHQGKTDAFHRLISLLDSQAFPDIASVTRERVQPYVIRTEKRLAIDADGKPLFKPRHAQTAAVTWEQRHRDQKLLYETVTEYVREGYNQALREKRTYIGFLMILMQRLVVSSTSAIRTAMEKRLQALTMPQEQLPLFPLYSEEEWADLDGQEQMETLLGGRINALKNEQVEVKLLLEVAARCEQAGPDAKAEALLDWLYRLQAEAHDPELKALIFTEFIPTQEMLRRFLSDRGFAVVCLNGSMDMEERRRVQEAFAGEARILISTDAGGEGLNLQFCHAVINYDIPWNPMRLEQRIGRVDRIGQTHTVRAVNFSLDSSVEHRIREVLEKKLAIILEEFGIDKTGDILDSAQAGRMFDELYVEAILDPNSVEDSVDSAVARLREGAQEARATASVLGSTEDLDPWQAQRLLTHPLPHWVERMTVSYLKAHGGVAERKGPNWNLTWPDGQLYSGVVFTAKDAEENPAARHVTLEDPRVRGLAMRLPRIAPGQPVPVVSISGVAPEIQGFWSLWRIAIATAELTRRKLMPLFLADNGKVYAPTARHIWDQLLVASPIVKSMVDMGCAQDAFTQLEEAAEEHGRSVYDALLQEHRAGIAREREKAEYAFAARRRAIERIGLPQVRNYRLNLLAQEERASQEQFVGKEHAYPEMVPILLIRVEGSLRE